MKTEDILKQAAATTKQGKDLYNFAFERTRKGVRAADQMMHRNTYNVLVAGILAGLVTGFFVSRGCRNCAN
jgi:hypothetical protein